MISVPSRLVGQPFTTREAAAAGISPTALRGHQFVRVHRGVYVVRGTELDLKQRIAAATLALPADAHVSHITRIQQLGLNLGATAPLHFTVARDLHVTPHGVFLHRTKVLPPVSDGGIAPAAAFLSISCSRTLLDVVVIGDWLLHNGLMTTDQVTHLAHRDAWRPGAAQAVHALPYLNARAASPQETRSRCYLVFAGLPEPLVNVPLSDDPNSPILDLYCPQWMLAWEYEGGHHFRDPAQIKRDTWRYAEIRSRSVEYMQVFDSILADPKAFVIRSHQLLMSRGYGGPPPDFGTRWSALGRRIPRNLARPTL